MSMPVQVDLLSDDEDNGENFNKSLVTPLSKKPRTQFHPNSTTFLIIDDDPTPQKFKLSTSSTPSVVPETPFSDMPKSINQPIFRCTRMDEPNCASGSEPKLSADVGGLICLESDDEEEGGLERKNWRNNIKTSASLNEEDLERSPMFSVKDKLWEDELFKKNDLDNGLRSDGHDEVAESSDKRSPLKKRGSFTDFDVDKDLEKTPKSLVMENQLGYGSFTDFVVDKELEKGPKSLVTENQLCYGTSNADFDVECLDESPIIVRSTCYPGNLNSTKTYDRIHLEDDITHKPDFHDLDHGKESATLEEEGAKCRKKITGNVKAQKKQNKNEQAGNRKKSQEEKARLIAEKKLKKEQEKLDKAAMKAEAAKLRQLEKDKLRWEKEAEKNILAEIDTKVIELGSIGGPLITRFGEKGLRFNITSNPIGRSIVWRMTVPDEICQLSSISTDIPYVLLIYNAEEFCKVAGDGSIMDHISAVRTKYPSHTICCLTNRLASYINKREQDKYKNRKDGSDWQRPPVEEVFAKLTTHYANVHSRQCVDEAELAEHVAGLTINLAKCRFRKKLTPLSVNANGANVPKDCLDRALIMKNPWLKALICIPKVQPRFAVAIFKKYPTMKSLLRVYMDSTKSVHEKEFLLKDLTVEGLSNEDNRRLGEVCSKRVYRVLMARNGSMKTDDVETGGDYFTTGL